MKAKQLITALAVATALGGSANAAVTVIKPTDSAEFSFLSGRPATNTINDANATIDTGDTVPVTWPSLDQIKTSSWLSTALNGTTNTLADQWVVYDLGAVYDIGGVNVWGYGAAAVDWNRTMKDFTISFATTLSDTFGTQASVDADFSGPVSAALDPTTARFGTGTFTNLSSTSARYVLIDPGSIHNDTQYVGFGEIRFVTAEVPEPSTTALLGLGGLALILRRRK